VAWVEANRGAAIDDRATLAAFMDEAAAAFASALVDDDTRARVQHEPDELFAQPAFAAMLATARGEAYPVALSMIAETIEGALAPYAEDRAAQRRGLMWVVFKAFDRRPRPDAVGHPHGTRRAPSCCAGSAPECCGCPRPPKRSPTRSRRRCSR
jgi:hypothetical protein